MLRIVLLVVALTFAPNSAFACRLGGSTFLFQERPETPEGLTVIRARFANAGELFDTTVATSKAATVARPVGVVQLLDRAPQAPGRAVPVYAVISSCTHGFFGRNPRKYDLETYLVGSFIEMEGERVFAAVSRYDAGDGEGHWWPTTAPPERAPR